jgi:hypothetical protein
VNTRVTTSAAITCQLVSAHETLVRVKSSTDNHHSIVTFKSLRSVLSSLQSELVVLVEAEVVTAKSHKI